LSKWPIAGFSVCNLPIKEGVLLNKTASHIEQKKETTMDKTKNKSNAAIFYY
jgi:hypothetical protein